jgi:1-aminocyclopropane-1-carboxylate deaminase
MAIISPVDLSAVRIDELPHFDPLDQVSVSLLRLDLLHPIVSGNKWFKLSENLQEAQRLGYRRILTFGGAYSNHLIATAAAAQANGFTSLGIVRGQEFAFNLNPVLQYCRQMGMDLHFVSRSEYDQPDQCLAQIPELPSYYRIPEGGANEQGRAGMAAMAALIPETFTHICISVGSGTSFEGLRIYLPNTQQLLGFVPMKGGIYLESSIRSHLNEKNATNWSLTDAFAMGGFGKCPPELQLFMQEFKDQYGIETDRVYTAKMLYGLRSLLQKAYFPKGTRILCIHTGGLSGNWSKA